MVSTLVEKYPNFLFTSNFLYIDLWTHVHILHQKYQVKYSLRNIVSYVQPVMQQEKYLCRLQSR